MVFAKQRRILISTDAKNEADDQFAIIQALLSPTLDIRGIVAAHFGDRRGPGSMLDSRKEIDLLLRLVNRDQEDIAVNGSPVALPNETTPAPSDGSKRILQEATLASPEDPLNIAVLGPLTDVASALIEDPSIADKIVVVWIGGAPYGDIKPQSWPEFNLANDIPSANAVFKSSAKIVQVPMDVYRRTSVGYAELEVKIGKSGKLGRYLIDQLIQWNEGDHRGFFRETRALGDNPAIAAILNEQSITTRTIPARVFEQEGGYGTQIPGTTIDVVTQVDVRWMMEDMFAKIQQFGEAIQ